MDINNFTRLNDDPKAVEYNIDNSNKISDYILANFKSDSDIQKVKDLALNKPKMFYKNGVEMEHNKYSPDGGFGLKFIGSDGNLIVTREKIITNPKSVSKITISENQKRVYKSDNHYTDWIKSIKSRKDPICMLRLVIEHHQFVR
mgnify:CR=1 FL=1